MKPQYEDIEEFKKDLNLEYKFKDICYFAGFFREEDIVNGKIICPFHSNGHEKTGSCQIGDHWFRCYGCGAKGDIFTFIMLKNKCTFPEAIIFICGLLNTSIKNGNYKPDENSRKFKELANTWEKYQQNFIKYKDSNKELVEQGRRLFPLKVGYDSYINRIVICYEDENLHRVYGFSKRRLNENENPKWLHSKDNDSLIGLCHNIYNIDALYKSKDIVIVEGPGDVGGCKRANIQNAIATSGCENFNVKTLNFIQSKGVESVTFLMDNDAAGKKASLVNSLTLIELDYIMAENSFVASLGGYDGNDPGEAKPEEINDAINNKESMISYFLKNSEENSLRNIYNNEKFKYNQIRNDIINYICEKHDCSMMVANKMLNRSKEPDQTEYINRLKSTIGIDGFENIPPIENITCDDAKIILKRRFNINV